jgi:ABC-type transport system involved in multi-copper enzyme maturation permease subunit
MDLFPSENRTMSPADAFSTPWLARALPGLYRSSRLFLLVELAAAFVLAGEAGALLWWRLVLAAATQVLLWLQWLALVIVCRSQGLFAITGPVLFYDLVRSARRSRYVLVRCLYAGILTVLLAWVYLFFWLSARDGHIPANRMANFAEGFFYMFMAVQFAAVVILTPGYVAGAIAEEKDRKTLEFILTTELSNREIVLGKVLARLANLTLLLLTGLPILAAIQFLGGVDPNLVLAGFAATLATMVSLAAVGTLNSVYNRKPRDAIALTYVAYATYLLGGFSELVRPYLPIGSGPIDPVVLLDGFNAGNIVTALGHLAWNVNALDVQLPARLGAYLLFHGLVTVVCAVWATARIRAIALKETYARVKKLPLIWRLFGRPAVGRHPMLWKELFADPGLRFNWLGRLLVGLLVAASFVPVIFIVAHFVDMLLNPRNIGNIPTWTDDWSNPWFHLGMSMNVWERTVGVGANCLILLAVATRTAGSITGERERKTLDELLTTPLSGHAIVFAKWLGSILSVRWAWLWLGLIWGLGLITGGLHPLALVPLLLTWVIHAAVMAGVGLWFSVVCRSTLRATLWTLGTVVAISVGHWLVMMLCVYLPLEAISAHPSDFQWLMKLEAGLTPPFVTGVISFWKRDLEPRFLNSGDTLEMVGVSVIGTIFWVVAAVLLYLAATTAFRVVTGRERYRGFRRAAPGGSRLPAADRVLDVLPAPEAEPLDVLPAETENGPPSRTDAKRKARRRVQ